MRERILSRIWTADTLGLVLVLAALQTFTYGTTTSLIRPETGSLFGVCLLAVIIAWGLSWRKTNGVHAGLWLIGLGLLGVWVMGARLAGPLLALARASLSLIPEIAFPIRFQTPVHTTSATQAWLLVVQSSNALGARLQSWLVSLGGQETVNDPLVRNMLWIMILWLLAAWIGWHSARRSALTAFLPAVALLAAITSYSEHNVYTLWLMVFFLLLLMGVWNYRNRASQWETKRIDYSDSIRYDAGQAVLILGLALSALAFITPPLSWQQIQTYLRQRGQNEIAESLGVQPPRAPQPERRGPIPSLPRAHWLTGGFAQSEDVVMIVRTGELPPMQGAVLVVEPPRHYWRSVTYDTYAGTGWLTSAVQSERISPDTPLIPGLLNGYQPMHLDVQVMEPEGRLFWSGILFSADVPFRADWRLRPESSLFLDQAALLQADLFAAASAARGYRAEVYVPRVTVDELRSAPMQYPDELRDRYLQLPTSLPARVHQLAQKITEGQETAYDKARAIENYLRSSYPYDLDVPQPPPEEDVADHFLFELKRGYCDYYATAMVVLARASGLPARFVSGYAPGSYDAFHAQYVVRELHAHSWAEVYFPGYGWIEFEPTASQPEITHADSPPTVPAVQPSDSRAADLLYRFRLERALYGLAPIGLILIFAMLYFRWVEGWRYARLAPQRAIEQLYRCLYRWGRPLAGRPAPAETVSEFMYKLMQRMRGLSAGSRFSNVYLDSQKDVAVLTRIYQDTLFRDRRTEKKDVQDALRTWKHLRWRLFLIRVYTRIHALLLRRP